MSGVISSILVGSANGCSGVGYVAPNKKQLPMSSSDLIRARRLQLIGTTTRLSTFQSTKRDQVDYSQLTDIQVGNRYLIPLCKIFNK